MQKKFLIIPGVILGLLVILGILQVFLPSKKGGLPFLQFSPTPTPIGGSRDSQSFRINTKNPISIESTDPQNSATGVSLSTPIHITFSRPLDPSEYTFNISPSIEFIPLVANNTLTIKLKSNLSPNTQYSFFVGFKDLLPSNTYTFTTISSDPSITPAQGDTVPQHENQQNKINDPDVFLSNYTPYQTGEFSIDSALTPYPNDHFFFNVTLNKSDPQAKQSFINWLKSLTLSDDQIAKLDIRYL